jgi:hypothetical protein
MLIEEGLPNEQELRLADPKAPVLFKPCKTGLRRWN